MLEIGDPSSQTPRGTITTANTELTEQMEAVQDQNVDLQIKVAELNNQL